MTAVEVCSETSVARAADLIRKGEVVGFPTETVYGLGADARNPRAVMKIFAAKGRPGDNPLIVHIANINQLRSLVAHAPSETALKLAKAFWPGPLTMLFPKSELIPDCVTAGLDTVGIRMPSNAWARMLIEQSGCPIAAPSANRSGRPSPTTAQHVLQDMDGRIPMILDGGACAVGVESTVLDVAGDAPRVLRPGGVTPEMIQAVVGEVRVDESVMRPLKEGERPRSPGMKYRHYAPRGALTIFEGTPEAVAAEICARYDVSDVPALILSLAGHMGMYGNRRVLSLGADAGEVANRLFEALREADALGAQVIFSEAVDEAGIGLAVMNRLGRAAGFHVIDALGGAAPQPPRQRD